MGADQQSRDESRIVGCRSDYEMLAPDTEITVFDGGDLPHAVLRASPNLDTKKRGELIESVRGGKHLALSVRARTFRQRDGSPNKNFLRLNPAKLDSVAASYVGKPMLLDHRSWSQSARIGTITASELEQQGHGWSAFMQTLNVVKPEAVISVLDGTLDRFSIAWSRLGAVTCSAHKVDVTKRGSCGCWPGDTVEVDGAKHTVEFEFADAEGTETSGVNAPAVSGTRIEDVRAALAVELGIPRPGDNRMNLVTTLAAILGCAATDADVARATEDLKRGKLAAEQERDTARTKLAAAEEVAKSAIASRLAAQVDEIIAAAYRDGKLIYGRDAEGRATASGQEPILRELAGLGIEKLKTWLAAMPQIAPIGKRALEDAGRGGSESADISPALASAAAQLGLKPEDVEAEYRSLYGED